MRNETNNVYACTTRDRASIDHPTPYSGIIAIYCTTFIQKKLVMRGYPTEYRHLTATKIYKVLRLEPSRNSAIQIVHLDSHTFSLPPFNDNSLHSRIRFRKLQLLHQCEANPLIYPLLYNLMRVN